MPRIHDSANSGCTLPISHHETIGHSQIVTSLDRSPKRYTVLSTSKLIQYGEFKGQALSRYAHLQMLVSKQAAATKLPCMKCYSREQLHHKLPVEVSDGKNPRAAKFYG
jgi:hypothetical protein